MQRSGLLQKFRRYVNHPRTEFGWKGERTIAEYLVWWFDTQVKQEHEYTGILIYLDSYIADAMAELRTSRELDIVRFRERYLEEVGYSEFPNLTEVSFGSTERVLLIGMVSRLVAQMSGWPGAESQIEAYFKAKDTVIEQTLDEFLHRVYRRGLAKVIDNCKHRGMSGKFGNTELRSYVMAGRLELTFTRSTPVGVGLDEYSISFMGEEGDESAKRFGIQSIYAPFFEAIQMIEEVISNWPKFPPEQAKVFTSQDSVKLAGL